MKRCFGKPATIVSGKSTIKGTRRADVIFSTARGAANVINAGGGNDLICGSKNFDQINGGPGRDKIRGKGNQDFLAGGPGNDVLFGELSDTGYDLADYRTATGPVTADLTTGRATGDGTDTLNSIEGAIGSQFDDSMTGNAGINFFTGLGGNDTITTGAQFDFIDPGDGDDNVDGGEDVDVISYLAPPQTTGVAVDLAAETATGRGNDQIANFEWVWGTPFADELRGSGGDDAFFPFEGDDTLDGRGGQDSIAYWDADTAVTANLQTGQASSATDGTDAFTGIEHLYGSPYDDTLTGDNQSNILDGDVGNDNVNGGGGDDYFPYYDGYGNDTIDGAQGTFDVWEFIGFQNLDANLVTGTISGQFFSTSVTQIESISGGISNDVITGNDENNVLFGWFGDDVIVGGGGNDHLDGGEGVDQVDGGAGTDNCVNGETPASCEGDGVPPLHPLQSLADEIESNRRSLG